MRGARRGLGVGFACFIRPAQLQVEDSSGKEVRDGEEMQRYVDRCEGAGEESAFCRSKRGYETVGGRRKHQKVGHCEQGNQDERRCEKEPWDDKHDRRDARGVEEYQCVEGDHAELEEQIPKCQPARAPAAAVDARAEDICDPCN